VVVRQRRFDRSRDHAQIRRKGVMLDLADRETLRLQFMSDARPTIS
jgi:hypothetical protein